MTETLADVQARMQKQINELDSLLTERLSRIGIKDSEYYRLEIAKQALEIALLGSTSGRINKIGQTQTERLVFARASKGRSPGSAARLASIISKDISRPRRKR